MDSGDKNRHRDCFLKIIAALFLRLLGIIRLCFFLIPIQQVCNVVSLLCSSGSYNSEILCFFFSLLTLTEFYSYNILSSIKRFKKIEELKLKIKVR